MLRPAVRIERRNETFPFPISRFSVWDYETELLPFLASKTRFLFILGRRIVLVLGVKVGKVCTCVGHPRAYTPLRLP